MKHIKTFSLNESVAEEYAAMKNELSAKTQKSRDRVQELYREISNLQKEIKSIEDSYKEKDEALRKKAVEEEPEAGFISKHDRMRFNPGIVKRSAELRDMIISKIKNDGKKVDEDKVYKIVKSIAKDEHVMIDDMDKIYKAAIAADLYIHGM